MRKKILIGISLKGIPVKCCVDFEAFLVNQKIYMEEQTNKMKMLPINFAKKFANKGAVHKTFRIDASQIFIVFS